MRHQVGGSEYSRCIRVRAIQMQMQTKQLICLGWNINKWKKFMAAAAAAVRMDVMSGSRQI